MTLKEWQGEMNQSFSIFCFARKQKKPENTTPNGKTRHGGAVLGNTDPDFICRSGSGDIGNRNVVVSAGKICP